MPGAWLYLCLVLVLAAALRFYRLADQSIWLDEWPNVAHLSAPNPLAYVRLIQIMYPEQAHAPLYYFLQYFWAHLVGTSLVALRCLPVVLGLAGVPMAYLLGSYMYNRTAGLVAALCLALSPQHIWHAQEIRPYVLLTPLAIVSVYALLRALREHRKRWWAVNLLANCLMAWTHLFAVLLLVVEGAFLLLHVRRQFRHAALWAGLHVVFMIPWLLWLVKLPYSNEHPSVFHSVRRVFEDVLADDIVSRHTEILPSWKTHSPDELPPARRGLLSARTKFDTTLLAVLCGVALWLAAQALAPLLGLGRAPPGDASGDEADNAAILLLLLALPGLGLGILTLAMRQPFLSPMYTMYNTAALYVGVGGMVASLGNRARRTLTVTAVALLYVYQLAITLPDVTRTDWRAGAQYIAANGSPNDLVLDFEYFWPVDCLGYYLAETGVAVRRVTSLQAACDDALVFLSEGPAPPAGLPPERSVWLAVESAFLYWLFPDYNVFRDLEPDLRARGLACTFKEFPGHRNLVVVRIQPTVALVPEALGTPVKPLRAIDHEAILAELGAPSLRGAERDEALAIVRRQVAYWPPLNKFAFAMHAFDLVQAGHFELAEAMASVIVERYPAFGLGHYALALALAAQRRHQDANEAFEDAVNAHMGLHGLVGPFWAALEQARDPKRTRAEVMKLRTMSFIFADAMDVVREAAFAQANGETRGGT